jgi:hydroxyacylglutathione hydrolase
MFFLETIQTEGIAQLSYLVGDTETCTAAVIDPRTDVGIYVDLARKHGVSITHIFETHIHADFVSGSRSLADRVATAKIRLSGEQANYEFDAEKIADGDQFDFGSFLLTARHTPGHTPEHLAFEISQSKQSDLVWGIFSGDSLFVGSVGRPDLLGSSETEQLARQLYETLYNYYLKQEDYVAIYPCHGAGSACGADIGDRLTSTIGYERRTNEFLRYPNFDDFRVKVVDQAPPVPVHYPQLKEINARGPEIMNRLPTIPALPPQEFRSVAREPGVTIVDTRSMLAFGGGHIPGSISIGSRPEISNWISQMVDIEQRLLLVVDDDADVEAIQRLIVRTGHSRFAGYLAGSMKLWETSGGRLEKLEQMTVMELQAAQQNGTRLKILDVRSPEEWQAGHIPDAEHYFVADMRDRITGLDKEQAFATYCASGYRASIASSLMQSRGFKRVFNVPGSWSAWVAANLPVESTT